MKKFREWRLNEAPWVNPDIDKEKEPAFKMTKDHAKTSKKIGTLDSGHVVLKHTHSMRYDDHDMVAYTAHDPETKKVHLQVTGSQKDSRFNVGSLSGYKGNTVKAHEFYHHLITKHGIHLHSDYEQSEGGMKVWKKLHKMPGIHMQSFNGSSEKYSELKPSFQQKYDMDSSTRLAAKKK